MKIFRRIVFVASLLTIILFVIPTVSAVIISGNCWFEDKRIDGVTITLPIKNATITLHETGNDKDEFGIEKHVGKTYTNENGSFLFNIPLIGTKSYYTQVWTETNNSKVYDTNAVNTPFSFQSSDQTVDSSNPSTWRIITYIPLSKSGPWIALDTIKDDHTFWQNTVGHNQEWISVNTPSVNDKNSYNSLFKKIFLRQYWVSNTNNIPQWGRDEVSHEYAHAVMHSMYGNLPYDISDFDIYHTYYTESKPGFALVEGWAGFVQCAIYNNPNNMAQQADEINIEKNTWGNGYGSNSDGSIVEGAVASILWDIYDSPTNDDDQLSLGLNNPDGSIWHIMMDKKPKSIREFWSLWMEEYSEKDPNYGYKHGMWAIFKHNNITIPDTTPPWNPTQIIWIHPVGGTWYNKNTIDITVGGAYDDISGVDRYGSFWFKSDQSNIVEDWKYVNADPITTQAIIRSPSLPDGSDYYFYIVTYDQAGNYNPQVVTVGPFNVDTTPPSTPIPHIISSGNSNIGPTIGWDTSDLTSGILEYYYCIDDTSGQWIKTTENPITLPSQSSGPHIFYVVAKDKAGNSGTTAGSISFDISSGSSLSKPIAEFAADKLSGESPLTVQLSDKSTGSPTQWLWDFGDNTAFGTTSTVSHTYENVGKYTVKLTVTNAKGTDTKSKDGYIAVNPQNSPYAPVAGFTANPTQGTVHQVVQFTDASFTVSGSHSNIGTYLWNFGDGSTSTEQSPLHQYNQAGLFPVSLTVKNEYGTSIKAIPDYIAIKSSPSGVEWQQQTSGSSLPMQSVFFINENTGWILNKVWKDGGGGFLLKTTDGGSTWTSLSPSGLPLHPSSEIFFIDQNTGWIIFDDSTSEVYKTTNGGTSWSAQSTGVSNSKKSVYFIDPNTGWIAGAGGTILKTTNSGATWTQQASGTTAELRGVFFIDANNGYACGNRVILTTTDGGNSWTVHQITSNQGDLQSIHFADKDTGWTVGTNGELYRTLDGGSTWIYSNLAEWASGGLNGVSKLNQVHFTTPMSGWIAGDGGIIAKSSDGGRTWTPSSAGVPNSFKSLSFPTPYTGYAVGESGMIVKYHTTSLPEKPNPRFTASITHGPAPLSVHFTDQSTGAPTQWLWDFGDQQTSALQNPDHVYQEAGKKSVTLTVANNYGGLTKYSADLITVDAAGAYPVADFYADCTTGNSPLLVHFTDLSSGSPTTWNWSFGDGTFAILQTPHHTYQTQGNYTVTLNVTNADGYNSIRKIGYINVTANMNDGNVIVGRWRLDRQVGRPDDIITYNFNSDGSFTDTHLFMDGRELNYDWGTWEYIGNDLYVVHETSNTFSVICNGGILRNNPGADNEDVWHKITSSPFSPAVPFPTNLTTDTHFDQQTAGAFPSGWGKVYSGRGWEYAIIDNVQSNSSANSVKLEGAQSWSQDIGRSILPPSDSSATYDYSTGLPESEYNNQVVWLQQHPDIWFECNVMTAEKPSQFNEDRDVAAVFFNKVRPDLGRDYGGAWFKWNTSAGYYINSYGKTMSYQPNEWYNVKVHTNLTTRTQTSWINDVVLAENVPIDSTEYPEIFKLVAGNGGTNTKAWFDDVKIGYSGPSTEPISTPGTTAPVASFTADRTSGTTPLSVSFADLSSNTPTGWTWFFGDENYSNPWTQMNASAGWSGRTDHSSVAMPDGSIVMMGGYDGSYIFRNDVWRSIDNGATWTQMNASAGWFPRAWSSSVVMPDGSIVLMGGGQNNDISLTNDVWQSTDNGATWTQVNASAGWSARQSLSSVAMPDGSIVLMGGRNSDFHVLNDVWMSTDYGKTWVQVNASAGWSAREGQSSVAMPDGSIILMGGYTIDDHTNDVWQSTDNGATWTQVNASVGWSGRAWSSSVVMPDGSIVLMGGLDDNYNHLNDVWRSKDDGVTWTEVNASANWTGRMGHSSVVVLNGSIVLNGGSVMGGYTTSDVWRFNPIGSSEKNPSHIYKTPGNYSVTLQAYNVGGFNSTRKTGYIQVLSIVVPLPGQANPPTDPDADGLYEDLNGNAALDFNDVQIFFRQMDVVTTSEPIASFDFNHNGGIDFNDIQLLFRKI